VVWVQAHSAYPQIAPQLHWITIRTAPDTPDKPLKKLDYSLTRSDSPCPPRAFGWIDQKLINPRKARTSKAFSQAYRVTHRPTHNSRGQLSAFIPSSWITQPNICFIDKNQIDQKTYSPSKQPHY
jgi:hypothetical protein